MANKGLIIGGVVALIGGGSIAGYFLTKIRSPPTVSQQVITKIELSTNVTNIQPGDTVTFTAIAYDQNGNPMSGVPLTLFDQTTSIPTSMGSTNASGQTSITIPFNTAGSFVLYAED